MEVPRLLEAAGLLTFAGSLVLAVGSSASACPGPIGDVNQDGRADVGDVLLAVRMVEGALTPTAIQLLCADVAPWLAPDGEITAADVAVLLRAVRGDLGP